jgi:pyruvate carboxylase subunit B
MKFFVRVNGREIEVDVEGGEVSVGGRTTAATLEPVPGTPVRHLVLDGRSLALPVVQRGRGEWTLAPHGERYDVDVVDERTRHIRSLTGPGEKRGGPALLKAPMPGLVVRVQVDVGQRVTAGTPVVVLEAMKMENQLKAPAAAIVTAVHVAAGEAVEKGRVLLELGPDGDGDAAAPDGT